LKSTRANIILPTDLIDEIDRIAGARQRSRFLAEAAREKLARVRFDRAAVRAFGAWTDEDHPDLRTDAELGRYLKRVRASTTRRIRGRLSRGQGPA
jgi:hypothetical protein